jgi:chemotaxis protein CheC
MDKEIDSFVVDALKEISNISAGHLSEVVSQLTGKEMSISTPDARIVRVNDAVDTIGDKGTPILVGYMNVFGDVTGSMVFILSKKDAVTLSELTLDSDVSPIMFPSPLEKDALIELVTIAGTAYLSSVTQFLGTYFVPTSPAIAVFGAFDLLNYLKTRGGTMEEWERRDIVLVSIELAVEGTNTKGELLMLVGPTILDCVSSQIKDQHGK